MQSATIEDHNTPEYKTNKGAKLKNLPLFHINIVTTQS